jgi:hypothetical protein
MRTCLGLREHFSLIFLLPGALKSCTRICAPGSTYAQNIPHATRVTRPRPVSGEQAVLSHRSCGWLCAPLTLCLVCARMLRALWQIASGATLHMLQCLRGGMPASAPRIKMPANNRMHSSAALRTTDMWSSVIGDASSKANDAGLAFNV